jgi:uncharacterized protein (TIGR02246 family)
MIRRIELLSIGLVLFGSVTISSFGQGQCPRPRAAIPAPAQLSQVVALIQSAPVRTLPASAMSTVDEDSVRHTLAAYVAAYNQKDAAKLVEFLTPDGRLADSGNVATGGREAISQDFSEAFAEPSTYTLEGKVEGVRLITPDVAQAEGVSRLVSPDGATVANHSWIFNPDGSRGEGAGTRAADKQWVAKAQCTTGDGLANTATQVISLVNKDAVKASSIDLTLGGESARDIEDLIMVRKPPVPGAAPAAASAPTSSTP